MWKRWLFIALNIRERFGKTDVAISCGDLPFPYLEYVISMLDIPLYYVHGNHLTIIETPQDELRLHPWGGAKHAPQESFMTRLTTCLIGGIEGSLQIQQRSQSIFTIPNVVDGSGNGAQDAAEQVALRSLSGLLSLVTVPQRAFMLKSDYAHRGVHAFRWLLRWFSPKLHLHGHVHLYMPNQPRETIFHQTRVVNAYKFIELELNSQTSFGV